MKSLSDDITIKLPTTGMAEGYVTTKIYANGIGVFTGRSYIPGDDSSLYVNVNDIAVQNRGKDDYLKLNDDGQVETVPLVNDTFGAYSYQRRWNRGQVNEYKVNISNDEDLNYDNTERVLTGYDYQNRDLKPTSMDEEDSSLYRIMQGCDWIYNHDEEIGSFQNLLIPHYPLKQTNKYGFGLQIGIGGLPIYMPNPYSLRRDIGPEVELGSPIYGFSNTTFLTLNDLINGITGSNDNDSDVSIYLKQSGVSEDEFGDWVEGYTKYPGEVKLNIFIEKQYIGTELPRTRIISRNIPTLFKAVVETYITQASKQLEIPQEFYNLNEWDARKITNDPDTLIYYYASRISEENAQDVLDEYISYYSEVTTSETLDKRFTLTPVFSSSTFTIDVPDIYYGTCPVAILDRCYSRYYLAWNDRYGDIQSQSFDGKIEYTEDMQKIEIKDYKMRRRVIHNELQPKWKLNTKWLSEDVYPMYESIFTSPYLLLYDTQTDRSWNVILTDNKYTEKTYKNQKALFNLEITVEANTKENRIF